MHISRHLLSASQKLVCLLRGKQKENDIYKEMRIIKQKLRKREREQIPTYQHGEINCIDDENK